MRIHSFLISGLRRGIPRALFNRRVVLPISATGSDVRVGVYRTPSLFNRSGSGARPNDAIAIQTYWYIPFHSHRDIPLRCAARADSSAHPPRQLFGLVACGIDPFDQCARRGEGRQIRGCLRSMSRHHHEAHLCDQERRPDQCHERETPEDGRQPVLRAHPPTAAHHSVTDLGLRAVTRTSYFTAHDPTLTPGEPVPAASVADFGLVEVARDSHVTLPDPPRTRGHRSSDTDLASLRSLGLLTSHPPPDADAKTPRPAASLGPSTRSRPTVSAAFTSKPQVRGLRPLPRGG